MEHLRCVVERITYQNEENGYTVLKCAVKNYSDLVTVVGTMPDTHVGSVLSLEGFWKMDAKYGRQFCVERFEETLPATVYGIEKYLGSGLVKGIGPVFARKIVEKFGENTLDIIDETPEELIKVPGIGKVRAERIKTSWKDQKEIKNIMLFLQSNEEVKQKIAEAQEQAKLEEARKSVELQNEQTYRLLLAAADSLFSREEYPAAKEKYASAKQIKTKEPYPQEQIRNIDRLLAEIAQKEAITQQQLA